MPFAIAAAVVGFVIAFGLTPATASLARRWGILDHPDEGRKQHGETIPYLGGVAIALGFAAGATLLLGATGGLPETYVLGFGVALALGAVGVADDIRPLPRTVKFAAQLGAAVAAYALGFRVSAFPWEALNVAVTLVWVIGITNAFNLLDNMDGLTAGLAAIAAGSFAVMGIIAGPDAIAIVGAALAGSALGFLAHNRHPAKVFMGDAGSLLLGYSLALLGVRLEFENLPEVTFFVPVVVLGLPIVDTTLVVTTRLLSRQSPFVGARDHVSHRLVRMGLPVRTAVGLLYWAALCLGWLGLVITRSNVQVAWMLLGFVVAVGLFFMGLLMKIPASDKEVGEIAAVQEPVDLEEAAR